MLIYRLNAASEENILEHLLRCSPYFSPPLNEYVNIEEYAFKIHANAETIEAWFNRELVGLIAVYLNNSKTKDGFITNVSVDHRYHGKAIASALMQRTIELAKSKNFRSLSLEVFKSNEAALNLYRKFGFLLEQDFDKKVVMKWIDDELQQ